MKQIIILIGLVILVLFAADFAANHTINFTGLEPDQTTLFATNSDGSPEKYRPEKGNLFATNSDGSPEKNRPEKGILLATSSDGEDPCPPDKDPK